MSRRRVAVQLVLELLGGGRREAKGFADDIEKVGTSAKSANKELGAFSRTADQAANQLRNSRGRFATAGSEAGRAFADGVYRDASGRLRTLDGRFAAEGERLGASFSRGMRRGAGRTTLGLGSFGGAFAGGRAMLLLAGGAAAAVAALQVIPPTLAAIGGGLAAIPPAAAGATASIATLALGLEGIGGAIGEVFDPPSRGGGGGIDQTAAATRRLAAAQREAEQAAEGVVRARREEVRNLRDMQVALGRVALDERGAALAVREAIADLAEARERAQFAPSADTQLALDRAQLAYDEALQTVTETSNRAKDLREDQAAAAKAGVEGSDRVEAALERQRNATEGVIAAQEALAAAAAGGGASLATAYDTLSVNGKKLVDAIRAQKEEITGLRRLAQDRVLAGLDAEFTKTFTQTLPFAQTQIRRFGDTWNDTFKQLFRLGRDPAFLAGLEDAFESSDRFYDKVNQRIPTIGNSLRVLFTTSQPFVDRFGDSLLSYIDDFDAFLARGEASGSLQRFFSNAAEQADALLDLSKEIIRLFARMGSSGQASDVLRNMADAVKRFNDEAKRMENLPGIIETGNEALRGVVDVLKVMGDTLGDTLADPGTQMAVRLFFDILEAGAEVAGAVAQVFDILPDEVQAVVLAGLALAGIWGRLSLIGSRFASAGRRVGDALGSLNDRLGQSGNMGAAAAVGFERAGRQLSRLVTIAGRAGVVFALLTAADAVFGDLIRKQPADVRKLTASLDEFSKTGRVTGELLRSFGQDVVWTEGDLQGLRAAVSYADNGFTSFFRNVYQNIPLVGDALDRVLSEVLGTGLVEGAENLEALDEALSAAVNAGGVKYANDLLADLAVRSGTSIDDLKAKLPGFQSAVEAATTNMAHYAREAKDLETRQAALNDLWGDGIIKAGGLAEALGILSGGTSTVRAAQRDYKDAVDNATEALEENGRTLDDNTEAGRDNAAALDRIAEAAVREADAVYEATEEQKGANAAVQASTEVLMRGRAQLIETAKRMGMNQVAAENYADSILGIPQNWATALRLKNVPQSMADAEAYKAFILSIPSEIYTYFTTGTRYKEVFGKRDNRWGGLYESRRWGGVDEYARMGLVRLRQAEMYSTATPARYGFAEPATGGEAFIPKRGIPERSISIGRRAMEWYGYDVVPKSATANMRYGAAMSAGRPATIDYNQLGAAVASHLAPGLAAVARAIEAHPSVVQVDSVEIARATRAGERDLDRRA